MHEQNYQNVNKITQYKFFEKVSRTSLTVKKQPKLGAASMLDFVLLIK